MVLLLFLPLLRVSLATIHHLFCLTKCYFCTPLYYWVELFVNPFPISKINPLCLPNYGEALAARLVVSLALSLNLGQFILERDSQVVISTLQHPYIPQDWSIFSVILETIDDIPASIS
jgi:hypothetical protein